MPGPFPANSSPSTGTVGGLFFDEARRRLHFAQNLLPFFGFFQLVSPAGICYNIRVSFIRIYPISCVRYHFPHNIS